MSEDDIWKKASGQYKLIYADPPWRYNNTKTGRNGVSGVINKYPTMSVDEICELRVQDIADKESVLFLWSTTPLLPYGFQVMEAWGFKYKTAIYWHKMSNGMGNWFRGQVEVLLMGIRGRVKSFHCQRSNFFSTKPKKHSQKPHEIYELLESLELNPKIELFARDHRQGWDTWGNECPTTVQTLIV